MRRVEWDSLSPNFMLVLNPAALADYPATFIASTYTPNRSVMLEVSRRFPSVTVVDLDGSGPLTCEADRLLAHDANRKFDREDLRLIEGLASFEWNPPALDLTSRRQAVSASELSNVTETLSTSDATSPPRLSAASLATSFEPASSSSM